MEYGGPAGKLRKVFEEVSALPRRQQDKVVEFVAAFDATCAGGAHGETWGWIEVAISPHPFRVGTD